ncbi:hypothetical protein ASPZODRAFT_155064 [Penicilliopsis zonata CBS 506.65]|uniref:DUF7708 domain-containing protein n=1 Tax=Penicilliopsis zonata CBS 506.65 TaxID=1073090 RepID=A0A1L9S6Q5_9EURO|nr:hypothetical protein ASPZODRAFT_155064 [Penicilliopsis zonata CBS 506.65]OJJ42805.1 hypothetical protein ASPZODRAFT_155064 [Penicilliopsis zonata CBS 506.65]
MSPIDHEVNPESTKLIRAYSWEVQKRLPPGNDAHLLGQALSDGVDGDNLEDLRAPWRRFFEGGKSDQEENPATKIIAIESEQLRKKWLAFYRNCPPAERLDLDMTEPTMESVVKVMADITHAWRARREKSSWRKRVEGRFIQFSRTVNAHQNLLQILPQSNQYVSLFTGAINAIIKASVNHEKIIDGLTESLCTINEDIVRCQLDQSFIQTSEMRQLVADLYAHIFLFLSSVMDWLMEKRYKRMLDSFNESFSARFDNETSAIHHRAGQIRELAERGARAEGRITRLTVEELQSDIRLGLQNRAREQADRVYWEQRIEQQMAHLVERQELMSDAWKQLASAAKQFLQEGATDFLWLSGTGVPQPEPAVIFPVPDISDVLVNSRHLEDFFARDRVRLPWDVSGPLMLSNETVARLSSWSDSNNPSTVLWLQGEPVEADDMDNPGTVTAARFVDLADRAGVPVISYFCQLNRRRLRKSVPTREAEGLIALLYSLVRQTVELLLPRFETHVDLSATRFQRLDGSWQSWNEATSVLCDVLRLIPPSVLCVVDGLHWLDDKSISDQLAGLLEILMGGRLRLLVTTTGRSACLGKMIPASEALSLDTSRQETRAMVLDI